MNGADGADDAFHDRATVVRANMGGHGGRASTTAIRRSAERIDALLDPGASRSWARSPSRSGSTIAPRRPATARSAARRTLDGRPVIVYGDDLTVRQGSSALVGMRKTRRMEQLARCGPASVHRPRRDRRRPHPRHPRRRRHHRRPDVAGQGQPHAPRAGGDGDRRQVVRRLLDRLGARRLHRAGARARAWRSPRRACSRWRSAR